MLELHPAPSGHVDPARSEPIHIIPPPEPQRPKCRHLPDDRLLPPRDRLERGAARCPPPRLHLPERHPPRPPHDQVDVMPPQLEAVRLDIPPRAREVRQRQALPLEPPELALIF